MKEKEYTTKPKQTFAFDALSVRRYDRNGYLHVESSHITKEAVNQYYGREIPGWESLGLQPEKIYHGYRAGDELRKAVPTFNGLPLQLEHHVDSAENPQKDARVGSVGTSAEWRAPYIDNALTVTDRMAIDAIESGRCRALSSSYRYTPDFTAGEFMGERYDFVMRDICGNHVALVAEGRAGADVVVADSGISNSKKNSEVTMDDLDKQRVREAFEVFAEALKGDDRKKIGEASRALVDALACTGFGGGEKYNEPEEGEGCGAMDAALLQSQAEESVMRRFRELSEAARAVRPLIGEIVDPMAFDSADGIYRKALELRGISTAQYSPAAYRGMVDMLLKQPASPVVMDSAMQKDSPFGHLKNIRVSR